MRNEGLSPLPEVEIERRLRADLPCWHYEDGWLRRTYRINDWNATLMLVNAVGHLAEAAWHHPVLSVSCGMVEIRLQTHDAGGVTCRDFALARKIDEVVDWKPGESQRGRADAMVSDESRFGAQTHA
ncbi:4a-hydroxytetrahydrobiopterin dehydratase [Xanthobacter sp. TB0139]|uniref:4a-hydroxytetrahydrobiopterin dehydratase n=1 Tax=Xanthobacter sp. TB0139 TaxID=3459178 RepID=UPI0040399EE7